MIALPDEPDDGDIELTLDEHVPPQLSPENHERRANKKPLIDDPPAVELIEFDPRA